MLRSTPFKVAGSLGCSALVFLSSLPSGLAAEMTSDLKTISCPQDGGTEDKKVDPDGFVASGILGVGGASIGAMSLLLTTYEQETLASNRMLRDALREFLAAHDSLKAAQRRHSEIFQERQRLIRDADVYERLQTLRQNARRLGHHSVSVEELFRGTANERATTEKFATLNREYVELNHGLNRVPEKMGYFAESIEPRPVKLQVRGWVHERLRLAFEKFNAVKGNAVLHLSGGRMIYSPYFHRDQRSHLASGIEMLESQDPGLQAKVNKQLRGRRLGAGFGALLFVGGVAIGVLEYYSRETETEEIDPSVVSHLRCLSNHLDQQNNSGVKRKVVGHSQ